MRCPICTKTGDRHSFQQAEGPTKKGPVERFWDQYDQKHIHDHAVYTTVWTCSRGHSFGKTTMARCPRRECEWNDRPEVKAGEEPLG